MSKKKALLFNTDFTAEEKPVSIKDGSIVIDDKEFFVDDIKGVSVKGTLGSKELYFLKWKSIRPAKFERVGIIKKGKELKNDIKDDKNYLKLVPKSNGDYIEYVISGKQIKEDIQDNEDYIIKELIPIKPQFDEKTKILPKTLEATADMRFLSLMKKYAEQKAGLKVNKGIIIVMLFVITFIISFLMTLNYYGVL